MAIAYVNDGSYVGSGQTILLGGSVSIGDLLILSYANYYSGGAASMTVSDNVNSGNYSLIAVSILDGGSPECVLVAYKVCNASGTPTATITPSGGAGTNGRVGYTHWNGFVGTATALTAVPDASSAYGTSTALNSGSFTTSKNAEFVFGYTDTGSTSYATPPTSNGWTQNLNLGQTGTTIYSQIGVNASTVVQLNGTLSSSATWHAITQGFYDLVTAPPPFWGQICT